MLNENQVPPWERKSGPKEPKPKVERELTPTGKVSRTYRMARAQGMFDGSSKYTPEYADRLLEYFGVMEETVYTEDTGQDFSQKSGRHVNGKREGAKFPSIAGFCVHVKIGRDTFHRWATDFDDQGNAKYPGFPEAVDIIKAKQEDLLLNNGLKNYYNPMFSKFVLNTYHDKIEKTTRDVNMKGNINMSVDSDDVDL